MFGMGCWIGLAAFVYGAYIPIKAELAQYLIHKAWDESITTGEEVKPWGWLDTHPVLRLQSKKHNQDLIVLSGDTGNVLAFGPGLSSDTPYDGGGVSLVVSAHRDTHFSFLQRVAIGDEFIVTTTNNKIVYQVSAIEIIDTSKQDVAISNHQFELILVTCYPFGMAVAGGLLRYVVTARVVNES